MSMPPNDVFSDAMAPPPVPTGVPGTDQKQWALFAHLSAVLGAIVLPGWGCFVGPLVIWLIKKDTMPFVADQAKEALNFNITVAIAFVALIIFGFATLGLGFIFALPLIVLVGIVWLVLTIIATIKASEGIAYRYPFALRLVK